MIKDYLDSCAPLSEGSILGGLNFYGTKYSIPLNVSLELSLKCNFSCKHCYNYDRSGPIPENHEADVLSKGEIERIIGELAEAGTLNLSFTGGEVLLHPDLVHFIEFTRTHHMVPRIKTNASLLTEKLAKDLKNAGLIAIDISLYGATAATHEAFTRTKGTFEATLEGIRNSIAFDFDTSVSLIIHKGNFREYPLMTSLMDELGAMYSTSIDISARNDCTVGSLDERLGAEQMRELIDMPAGDVFIEKRPFDNLQCGCARLNCGISYKGEVYPCVGAPIFCGDLRKNSFKDIWENSEKLNWIRNLGKSDYKDCAPCPLKQVCPRNSGVTYSNYGDYTAKEPWSCMAAELIQDKRVELGLD